MTLESLIARIQSEWEPEVGFFWKIRQGDFQKAEFDRALASIAAVPAAQEVMPGRLVRLLWYAPIFMTWQVDRVREVGGDAAEYARATNKMLAEIERILEVP
jgi:hypothetical protein